MTSASNPITLGASPLPNGSCQFRVWAPRATRPHLHILSPHPQRIPLEPTPDGFLQATPAHVPPGSRYAFQLDAALDRPDPASRSQPDGVHKPSEVVDLAAFGWTDLEWRGLPWSDHVFYELHVGTFTPSGTLDAAIPHLPALRDLGITAIELMPLAQFPGARNWGYDGVHPYAVQNSYGGPASLHRFVNAAHRTGLAVFLDVVYNHLGPEGNYLAEFGPYFTNRYRTPWGPALNFDGPDSDPVRQFFIQNALFWQRLFHLDGLRLDAIHAICDFSAVTFLEELAAACQHQATLLGRPFRLVGESDLNMARHILPPERGGYGLDALWSDDFHHGLHVLLTGEQHGYYADFGTVPRFARTWCEGFAYTGDYSVHRRRRHGSSPHLNPPSQFVVCSQNHDQIGNRQLAERLTHLAPPEARKLAAAATLLSPFIPLLFMGEEYGDPAPFLYFVSHSDPSLIEAIRRGRLEEFAAFKWAGEVPDPQDPATFQRCVLNHSLASAPPGLPLRQFYRELLSLRRALPAISRIDKSQIETSTLDPLPVLLAHHRHPEGDTFLILHFGAQPLSTPGLIPFPPGSWELRLDSAHPRWLGPGSTLPDRIETLVPVPLSLTPHSAALYHQPTPT